MIVPHFCAALLSDPEHKALLRKPDCCAVRKRRPLTVQRTVRIHTAGDRLVINKGIPLACCIRDVKIPVLLQNDRMILADAAVGRDSEIGLYGSAPIPNPQFPFFLIKFSIFSIINKIKLNLNNNNKKKIIFNI